MHTLLDIGEMRLIEVLSKNVLDAVAAGQPIEGLI